MIHVRAVSPPEITPALVTSLSSRPGVLNMIVLDGVARNPDGDAVQFDVITAEANEVVARDAHARCRPSRLDRHRGRRRRAVGPGGRGRGARRRRALRLSPVWEQAEARIRAGGRYPPSWFALLTIAGLIAAVGIFTNSQILIVGAMVVGPEYAAIISVALGINKRDRPRIRAGAAALFFGFLIAIVVTLRLQRGRARLRSGARGVPSSASGRCPT